MDFDEIIEFENESTYIDFKAIEYPKEKYVDFLKDVISMANSRHIGPKYIVIGVKLKDDGTRSYLGLDKLTDSATFQKLVSDKIEPELAIDYFPYEFKNVRLGIIQIPSALDKPYVVKNQYKSLVQGDSFIRIGTHQRKLTRNDLDEIYGAKYDSNSFTGEIKLAFSSSDKEILEIEGIRELEFPSDEARKRILDAISKKEEELENEKKNPLNPLYNLPRISSLYGDVPYEQRSLEELKENLESVKKTYVEDDYFYYFEEMAQLLNFSMFNDSDKYLEDCSVELTIEETDHLRISDRVYEEPQEGGPFNLKPISNISHVQMNYPRVEVSGKKYIVYEHLSDLKHKMRYDLFTEPLRIVPIGGLEPIRVNISAKIFGKNLRTPIERTLELIIK